MAFFSPIKKVATRTDTLKMIICTNPPIYLKNVTSVKFYIFFSFYYNAALILSKSTEFFVFKPLDKHHFNFFFHTWRVRFGLNLSFAPVFLKIDIFDAKDEISNIIHWTKKQSSWVDVLFSVPSHPIDLSCFLNSIWIQPPFVLV